MNNYLPSDWRKSKRSNANDNCVEVNVQPAGVGIRDSKAGAGGPHLDFPRSAFAAFIREVQTGGLVP
ncbi:DUF397 domain-containing protein [Micromonospora sp. NPDC003197]